MLTDISSSLAADVGRVLNTNDEEQNLFNISCIFKSQSRPNWSWEVRDLLEFDILQNFIMNYTDLITLSFRATPWEYMDLVNSSQDLVCEVSVVRITHNEEDRQDPVLEFTHRAIIKDKKDLSRNYPINIISLPEDSNEDNDATYSNYVTTDVDLIDPIAYDARKRKINFCLRDATISDAVLTMCKSMGIDNVYFVKPDNEEVYENLWIPPSMGLSDVFNYLQTYDAYGIYNYGARAYITNGVLFLYPIFDLEPDQAPSINIYVVGDHMYHGITRFDNTINNVLHIVSNTGLDDVSLIEEGIENEGNWFACQQPKYLIDEWRSMNEGAFDIVNESMISLIINQQKAMTTGAYSPINITTDNTFSVRSKMAASHLTASALGWGFAIPMSIYPGQNIVMHHDTQDGYKATKAIPSTITYGFREHDWVGTKPTFICSCNMNLLCQLDSE